MAILPLDGLLVQRDAGCMKIDVLIFDGFDELDALAPFEVFANAGFDVSLVSLREATAVTASHGATVLAVSGPREGADLLLVPGGGWNDGSPIGARAEAASEAMPAALRAAHAAGVTLASVCTGAMLLASAGLLEGRPATTHHGAYDDLAAAGARLVKARVVDDGDIVTAGGVTSGIDLALWMIERSAGRELADRVAREMEYERRGPVEVAAAA